MKTPPEIVSLREFREHFTTYDRPIRVITTRGGTRVVGTWYPEPRKPKGADT